jgi:CCR4-NOT transcription complex subunit 1
LEEGNN